MDYSQQLLDAAQRGDITKLKIAIEHGADLEARDDKGRTAAMWAAGNGHAGCLALLIQAGIDPTKEILGVRTLLEICQDKGWEDVISAWESKVVQQKLSHRTSHREGDGFGL